MAKQLNKTLGTTDVIWNLNDLYGSLDDKQIVDDIDFCEKEGNLLKSDFSGNLSQLEPNVFAGVVQRLERIAEILGRLGTYAYLQFSIQVKNPAAGGFLQQIRETASRINREIIFFELEWAKMEEMAVDNFLSSEETALQHHHLKKIRRYAEHLLSHVEETLLIEFEPVGSSAWTGLFTKVMGHLQFGKDKRSEEEVLSDLYSPDRKTREQGAKDLTEGLKSQLHILTHIFNTLLADKMIDDRLRCYPSWVSSRNLDNELSSETVDTLISAVTSRYDIVQRYYQLKRELLDVDQLMDYDRYAPLPHLPEKMVDWRECREMVLAGFSDFSPQIAEIAELFFERKWIHAPLLEGKQGGAFAHPAVPDVHPYVLVNYTGNMRDVSTVAHELGHGVHQYLAKDRGYFNADTPLVLAETASVFAELLIFHRQLELIDNSEQKRAFVCQKLESIFATVFRQISMNRFEDKIHNWRRNEGELSPEKLSNDWMETQQEMFGDSVKLTEDYGVWWSYIPHFLHTPGYVYSYAFGELLVLALYSIYQSEGDQFVQKYMELLAQGGSASPYRLLEPFGIDLNDQTFWQGGLSLIDEMLQGIEG